MKAFFRASRLVAASGLVGGLCMAVAQAGIIEGVNHTHWAINKFSVDGRSGLDTIGPWQGGGGGHYNLPSQWVRGMTVLVEWETGVASSKGFPGFGDWPKFLAWRETVLSQTRRHSKDVSVPDFTGQQTCGVTIHFLPCDEIQVTTSCHRYGSAEYPIKIPLELPEPQSCPVVERVRAEGAS